MSATYTFDSKDILNCDLRIQNCAEYTIKSVSGLLAPKTTTVQSLSGGPVAVIHWREKSFEIDGEMKRCSKLRSKTSSTASARDWRWSDNRYIVRYSTTAKEWTATLSSSYDACVRFTPFKQRVLGKSQNAVITISFALQDEEVLFLIMVMLRSEMKRRDEETTALAKA